MAGENTLTPRIPGFSIEKRLGQGGMATVYLAEQTQPRRKVALKIMRAPPDADPDWSQRFASEAAMLERLAHPNIVEVYASGESEGNHYIAMEVLDHGDLTRWIREGLQPEDALRILRALAGALDAAHRIGYVHRDVKPDNVLFRADGTPVLTDFGIAYKRGNRDLRLTQAGLTVGTPRYMSPEQHRGQDVDSRGDIYALGVILHEMLTRKVPFDGPDALSIGLQHLQAPVPRLPPQFARFQRLLDAMLAKNPADRLGKGTTLVQLVDHMLSQPAPSAKKAIAAATVLERGVEIRERETKTGLFSKACDISVSLGAGDFETLQSRAATVAASLLEWHREVGKKARNVEVDLYVHPWILVRAKEFVRGLAQNPDYAFLHDLKAVFRLHNLDGVPDAEIRLGDDAGA